MLVYIEVRHPVRDNNKIVLAQDFASLFVYMPVDGENRSVEAVCVRAADLPLRMLGSLGSLVSSNTSIGYTRREQNIRHLP